MRNRRALVRDYLVALFAKNRQVSYHVLFALFAKDCLLSYYALLAPFYLNYARKDEFSYLL